MRYGKVEVLSFPDGVQFHLFVGDGDLDFGLAGNKPNPLGTKVFYTEGCGSKNRNGLPIGPPKSKDFDI